ncbi:arrestin domain-containing protein 3-like [Drosophila biarmipes]|uniref:arrestin domain-containing protein 3-like n=1 Tax=Drosophila biarmipes TaxID=125945 RepID=UPI0007E7F8C4|nr:arrestin domain-containing protein 3-like [Drosophila biarmipes]
MPSNCFFEFDRPDLIFYSGETINGRITLITTSEKSVNLVYVLFEGEAKVHWGESRTSTVNGQTQQYTQHFRGKQTYVTTRTNVFGSGSFPAGTHTYSFSIPLPPDCPSSVVGQYGKISYEISLVVDRHWRFNNVFKKSLTVLQAYNLNMSPQLMIPLMREDIKHFCCWPCRSGPVLSTLTIPFGGYAPGQRIRFTLEIDNQSSSYDLDDIEVKLKQIYTFQAQAPRKKTREKEHSLSQSCQEERVLRLSKKLINYTLAIPSVPPSTRTQDHIITVSYRVIVSLKMGRFHVDSDLAVPIVIGTIPLVQSTENPSRAAEWTPETPNTPAGAAADLPPSYEKCKPPTFEEATNFGERFIDIDADEHNRTDDFIPRYPMYTDFAMPSAPPHPGEASSYPHRHVPVLSLPYNTTSPPNEGSSTNRFAPSYGWNSHS